jgi:hypothetical protein
LDRLYLANILETRFIDKAQAKIFADKWAELITYAHRTDDKTLQLNRLLALINSNSDLSLKYDAASRTFISGSEVFTSNREFAEFMGTRFAPPTMYRDPTSGNWVDVSEVTPTSKQSDGQNGLYNWLSDMYRTGMVEVFVEVSLNGKMFRREALRLIAFYDSILSGSTTIALQLRLRALAVDIQQSFFEGGMGLNRAVTNLDRIIREII